MRTLMLISVASLLIACGGSAGSGAPGSDGAAASETSGLDGTKLVRALTESEAALMCDWVALYLGGYDRQIPCGDGTSLVWHGTREKCVGSLVRDQTCQATIADVEACARRRKQMQCDLKWINTTECKPVVACGGSV